MSFAEHDEKLFFWMRGSGNVLFFWGQMKGKTCESIFGDFWQLFKFFKWMSGRKDLIVG